MFNRWSVCYISWQGLYYFKAACVGYFFEIICWQAAYLGFLAIVMCISSETGSIWAWAHLGRWMREPGKKRAGRILGANSASQATLKTKSTH